MTYSDGTTHAVTYFYDQTSYNGLTITNGEGRRTGMSDGSGTTAWSYDLNGDVLTEKRTLAGITRTISYTYNKDNSLASLTYPSGRRINFTVGNAQRVTQAIDADGTQYALAPSSGVMYAPTGALSSAVYGKGTNLPNGLTENRIYNNRLQITGISASSSAGTALNLSYGYTNTNHTMNNGEIVSITNNVDTGRTQTFGYDDLSRILTASSQATSGVDCWGQSFTIDIVGNLTGMTTTQCSATSFSASVNQNNQFTTGYTYDAAGNLTSDGLYNYTYDAENEVSTAGGVTYTYDGNFARVKKSTGTLYWRAVDGNVIAETNLSGTTTNEYVLFSGRRVARRDSGGTSYYYQADHLGSTRAGIQSNGALCYDADFAPYGAELQHTGTCQQNYKFTGYERDSETGLDYAVNRYYNWRLGRFMSPDPAGLAAATFNNPQSMNRYAYVLNNPLSGIDPSGLNCVWDDGSYDDFSTSEDACDAGGGTWLNGVTGDYSPSPDEDLAAAVKDLQDFAGVYNAVVTDTYTSGADPLAVQSSMKDYLIAQVKGLIPKVCGGGGFVYGGGAFDLGKAAHAEVLGIVQYDTSTGGAHGGLVGAGAGDVTVGLEALRSWRTRQVTTAPIILGGSSVKMPGRLAGKTGDFGGLLEYDNGKLSIGGYAGGSGKSGRAAGGGGYITLSWSGC
jgi:RHS repeat-associated protein